MPFIGQPVVQIAISYSDYETFGCPICLTGEKSVEVIIRLCGESCVVCWNCRVGYTIVSDETEVVKTLNTELIAHPLSESQGE